MFHFPASRFRNLWIQLRMTGHYSSRVAPFGYLRINARVQLPEAFRSLPPSFFACRYQGILHVPLVA